MDEHKEFLNVPNKKMHAVSCSAYPQIITVFQWDRKTGSRCPINPKRRGTVQFICKSCIPNFKRIPSIGNQIFPLIIVKMYTKFQMPSVKDEKHISTKKRKDGRSDCNISFSKEWGNNILVYFPVSKSV